MNIKFLGAERIDKPSPIILLDDEMEKVREKFKDSWYEGCCFFGYWERGDSFLFSDRNGKICFCIGRRFLKNILDNKKYKKNSKNYKKLYYERLYKKINKRIFNRE